MKALMALGGLIGFAIGLGFGYAQRSEWPSIIWNAAIAAYVSGLLLRWWGRVWVRGLEEVHRERLAAELKVDSKSTPNPAKV